MSKREKPFRSVAKAISWRVLATAMSIVLVYFFTGNLTISLSFGLIEIVVKFFLYYFHERIWDKLNWGFINNQAR